MRATPERIREDVRRAVRDADEPIAVHRAAAAQLSDAVPFDRWCGLVLDPATVMATGGYHEEGLPPERIPRLLEVECTDDANVLPTLARSPLGVSTIHMATGGRPQQSARYNEVLAPSGLGRELRAVLRERNVCWGGLVLLRETSAPDFTDAELRLVAEAGEEIARAIRHTLFLTELRHRDAPDVPGMVLFDGDEVVVVSESAKRWLADVDDGLAPGHGLPYVVLTVLGKARAAAAPVQARLRTREGRWITLHGERLDDRRASVVVEPTRPYELAAVICDAYGLSARERDVARLAVNGCSNREIAEALWLSQWTVQDHLKKVFDKLDVHSRVELVSRLFFDQYVPRIMTGTPVGSDGWFITWA